MYMNFINTLFIVNKLRDLVPCIIFNDNHIHIFFDENDEYSNNYHYLSDIILPDLENEIICGIDGINDFFYQKDDNNNWYITTDGSNLHNIMLLDSIIDPSKTISNHMWEIYEIFGIEATRQFLIDEFMNVVSSDGTYINERHVKLLVDVMTQHGVISSISRYGMKLSLIHI